MAGALDRPIYTPQPPGTAGGATVDQWAYREFQVLSQALNKPPGWYLDVVTSPPTRPRDGLIAFADGVSWNPGEGKGLYVYTNGMWRPMSPPMVVSVDDFGAKGDNVTDDTVAIQSAINALPASGGTVWFSTGKTYKVTSGLSIGDGYSAPGAGVVTIESTRQGVYLVGQAAPGGFQTSARKITIRYAGVVSSGPLIAVKGPISGWGVKNLGLDGGGLMADGINIADGQNGEIYNCVFENFTRSIQMTSSVTGGTGHHGTQFNTFNDIVIFVPNVSGAMGILLTGNEVDGTSDSSFNTFSNMLVYLLSGAVARYGIYLKGCDSNTFTSVSVGGGGAGTFGVLFDYALGVWPSDNRFFSFDNSVVLGGGTPWGVTGTPTGTARPNIVDWVLENNATLPSNIPNVTFALPDTRSFLSLKNQTAQLNQTLILVAYLGLVRLNYYIETTQVGTAGTYSGKFFWISESGVQQSVTTSSISATTLGGYASGSVVMNAGSGSIIYQSNFVGVTGSLQYSYTVTLERLN